MHLRFNSTVLYAWALGLLLTAAGCDMAPGSIELPPLPARTKPPERPIFSCKDASSRGCQGNVHVHCERRGEFIEAVEVDCGANGQMCDEEKVCVVCRAGDRRCRDCTGQTGDCNSNIVEKCTADGTEYAEVQECGADMKPDICYAGDCVNACKQAESQNSYAGCQFFAADLDNAAIDDMSNASAQQFAVVVANPQRVPVEVSVEQNAAAFGQKVKAQLVEKKLVPPGDLEVFKLPRREVDGSSALGINDGTHSAVTSNAYRVTSNYPISAYQFNPLENVHVFSNDASLLLPVAALGSRYTVVGWPQTIGNSPNPDQDFDHTSSNEDLRAFLTVIGAHEDTHLQLELGRRVGEVVQAANIPISKPGQVLDIDIGPYDVVNLETSGLNGDFTGSRVIADKPVAVFVGSEASDVPMFGTYATRQCCADHLEEQLLPDSSASTQYIVGRMPARAKALNNAALPGAPLGVAEMNEPEWIRLASTREVRTHVRTTLKAPDDDFYIEPRDVVTLRADEDFVILADQPIHVLEALASQGVTGIPKQYPGGDPDIIVVPPVDQFRKDYIFLTPDKYAFDFVTIVAPMGATIQLDGEPLPDTCESTKDADALHSPDDVGESWIVHRCQLSFPEVTNGTSPAGVTSGSSPTMPRTLPGIQRDGAHTIVSDKEISIVVYGFDSFVSYAYVGGLNLTQLN